MPSTSGSSGTGSSPSSNSSALRIESSKQASQPLEILGVGSRDDGDVGRADVTVEAHRDSADHQELDAFAVELREDSPDIELRHRAGDGPTQPRGS
jgi:hypothetical protein